MAAVTVPSRSAPTDARNTVAPPTLLPPPVARHSGLPRCAFIECDRPIEPPPDEGFAPALESAVLGCYGLHMGRRFVGAHAGHEHLYVRYERWPACPGR
jgi:hypothetical protein